MQAPWTKCEVCEKHTNCHQIEAMRWAAKSFPVRIFFSFLFQSSAQISVVWVRSEIEKWFIKQHLNIAVMVLLLFSSIHRTQSRESSLIIDRKTFYFYFDESICFGLCISLRSVCLIYRCVSLTSVPACFPICAAPVPGWFYCHLRIYRFRWRTKTYGKD